MSVEFRLPELGDAVTSARLSAWLKHEGDTVEKGEPIAEVETDKTNIEIESPASGVLGTVHVEAGAAEIQTGTLLAVITDGTKAPTEAPPEVPVVSDVATSTSGTATADTSPRVDRTATAEEPRTGRQPEPVTATGGVDLKTIGASPLARRLARVAHVDLAAIQGTGRGGRIGKADVERAIAERPPDARRPSHVGPAPTLVRQPAVGVSSEATFREQPLSAIRRVTAVRLQQAKQTIPHFYLRVECSVDAALNLRAHINAHDANIGVTLTDIVVRASALALRTVPQANSTWVDDTVRVYDDADITIAVNTPDGLVTPIIRRADRKGLAALSRERTELIEKARSRTLKPHEYTGGTFTISNLGMYGVDSLYAIVNPPQSCILGVGAAVKRPVVTGGELAVGTMATVTLSADHRAIDGATGAELLAAFRRFFEEPALLALY